MDTEWDIMETNISIKFVVFLMMGCFRNLLKV